MSRARGMQVAQAARFLRELAQEEYGPCAMCSGTGFAPSGPRCIGCNGCGETLRVKRYAL